MAFRYNNKKISGYIAENSLSLRNVLKKLNMTGDKTLRGWIKGEDIRVSHLLNFANTFNLDLREFFFENDTLISEIQKTEPAQKEEKRYTEADMLKAEMKYKERINEMEKKHMKELMEKETEIIRREMETERRIRQELQEQMEQARETLSGRYEQRLAEKEHAIAILQEQIAEVSKKGIRGAAFLENATSASRE